MSIFKWFRFLFNTFRFNGSYPLYLIAIFDCPHPILIRRPHVSAISSVKIVSNLMRCLKQLSFLTVQLPPNWFALNNSRPFLVLNFSQLSSPTRRELSMIPPFWLMTDGDSSTIVIRPSSFMPVSCFCYNGANWSGPAEYTPKQKNSLLLFLFLFSFLLFLFQGRTNAINPPRTFCIVRLFDSLLLKCSSAI